MKLTYHVTEDYQDMSRQSAELVIETIKANPTGLYCFAGGDTPVGTLKQLVKAAASGEVNLSQASFIELDEWVGIDPSNAGSCVSYLSTHLWGPAGIKSSQINTFDSQADDLVAECCKANAFIEAHGGLTLSLLGVGVNGHLGFNEPGVSFNNEAHVIELDETTQEVGKKYFSSEAVDRSKGISLGIKQLLASKVLIVQASGPKKKIAVQEVLKGTITNEWPITAIWNHADPVLIVDKAAIN